MSDLINKLTCLINKKGSDEDIENIEDLIVESIEKFAKRDDFYKLPLKTILRIIRKSFIEDVDLICIIIQKMNETKGNDSINIIKAINPSTMTFDECIKIISMFDKCSFCKRTGELFKDMEKTLNIDYEYEIEKLKNEIDTLKHKTKRRSIILKPTDYEENIHKASEEGKLTSIQYNIQQKLSEYIEAKNDEGRTPLIIVAKRGHLDIVKYLCEVCHVDVETKEKSGFTAINGASFLGHLDIVKYLYETCYANIETKDNIGCTPIRSDSYNTHHTIMKYINKK